MASEETVIKVMDLPCGQDWLWFPDLNMVGISSRLSFDRHQQVLDQLQAHWRREHLRVVVPA